MDEYKKKNIFLVGPMGAGKSTIGRHLSRVLNMKFYDSDVEIERRTGVDIAWVFDVEGESEFRIREEKIINELTNKTGIILSTGGGSIISIKSRNCLISRGIVIYLRTTVEEQLIRTRLDKKRPLLSHVHSKNEKILRLLSKIRDPIYQNISDFIVDTQNQSISLITSSIIRYFYHISNNVN
ncbi:Shikimate kinase 1 [Buchnera aphidicola (Cinara kochiana kochiana)]|uniref:Shikimate kinase 1 n=1 Tax=Buchnera aphidicola (Cinara kochiana kochiana) TaxID=2518976 RepID=A0A451D5X9_9GAMM|nr:shikimate kinase AroK [Buchnera aphidicola]VFP81260.1 Shikimate kinase 1 [Buchnera aphidicola (Cinara kochiana kochiana)]